ncbi:MAG: glycosyltransferase [Methylococcales bacterium]|nr:glycosyltransferase [Methylococcales bacterium]
MSKIENKTPLVSVIITCYNREEYIAEAIESVLHQNYQNLEIIISDNCSTDRSLEIINRYKADERIKVFTNTFNTGMIKNFQKATELAKGKYITYVSSDDYFIDNEFISDAVNKFERHERVSIVASDWKQMQNSSETGFCAKNFYFLDKKFFNFDNIASGKDVFLSFAKASGSIGTGGAMFSRRYLLELNPPFLDDVNGYMDFRLSLLLNLKGDVAYIPRITYVWRLHDNNASSGDKSEKSVYKFIKDISFIQSVYEDAKASSIFDIETLDNWKHRVYKRYLTAGLIKFYESNILLYNILNEHIKYDNYRLYEEIHEQPKFILYKILLYNKIIGSIVMYIYRLKMKIRFKH